MGRLWALSVPLPDCRILGLLWILCLDNCRSAGQPRLRVVSSFDWDRESSDNQTKPIGGSVWSIWIANSHTGSLRLPSELWTRRTALQSEVYEWADYAAWDPHLPGSNCGKFQISCFMRLVQCLNDQKKSKIHLLDFIWLQNDQNSFQKWPLSLKCLCISDSVLMILNRSKSLQVKFFFFWSFGHRQSQISQEIWNLTEIKSVKGWVHALIQPKWGHGQLAKFKQGTPTSMAQIVSNFLTNLGCPMLKSPEKNKNLICVLWQGFRII